MALDLNERQRHILARLVSEYIEQGEPVSSAWLAEHSDLGLSSATVRHILAHLEEQGFVKQPHTSAGRVPTDSGYRRYVDGLLGGRKRRRELPDIEARLRRAGTAGDVFENASQEISRASHHIGFVLAPAAPSVRLHHIDFVTLDERRLLVIVVSTGGHITHKVIDAEDPLSQVQLSQAANYLNREYAGLTLPEVRAAILQRLQQDREIYDALVARALRLARSSLEDLGGEESLHVQGTSFLVDDLVGDEGDRERTLEAIRALFRVIEEKHRLVALLTRYIDEGGGLTVVIGSEHGVADLHPFSVVASTFHDGQRAGTVGVIGPTRMRYQRAIAVVDGVSQVMTRVLDRH
jgi:heat-inducible transcriptional repressor